LAWLDARTLKTQAVFETGVNPNGVAIIGRQGWAIVVSIGDNSRAAKLEVFERDGRPALEAHNAQAASPSSSSGGGWMVAGQ
jgi:hypothetical protein